MEDFRCYYLCGTSVVSATYLSASDERLALHLARLLYQDKLQSLTIDNLELWQGAKMITSLSLEA